ncbi:MAG: signal recognition particle protein Srp54 [Candidatus Methanospirare jalkutatii]|nr:signal recognition particle protein Srp54 [Candidatus Methanospirare jalkutatii]MCW7077817.1 signal recognition particle protein Srp54 [Candidatus Methanoxibalbensis ujae]
MHEGLSRTLRGAVQKLIRANRIDRRVIDEVVRDIQRALIQADVKISLVKRMSNRVRERVLREEGATLNPREYAIRVVYEELLRILGRGVEVPLSPQKILVFGLNGSGKTLSCAKLARFFQKKGLKPAVICADVHRPAASEQLKQLCSSMGVPFYDGGISTSGCDFSGDGAVRMEEGLMSGIDAVDVALEGLKLFEKYDVKIIDTAGRHALESDMIEELRALNDAVNPEQRLLVIDAAIGQLASEQAKAFDEAVGITGIILTKMDGTAKGGGALSAVSETNAGIAFIGTGEKIDDIERFIPERFISRLLGFGDIQTLMEIAEESVKQQTDEETVDELGEKILRGKFTLRDMYKQLEALRKMGPLKKLLQMMPFGTLNIDLNDEISQITEEKLRRFKAMMDSMTDEELNDPRIINASRIRRIARGSGTTTAEVSELLKYHRMMQRMLKGLSAAERGRGGFMTRSGTPIGKILKKFK